MIPPCVPRERTGFFFLMSGSSSFQGAVLKEQGVTFAVVRVDLAVFDGPLDDLEAVRESFAGVFGDMPIVLMVRERNGRKTFHGRRDIARFLSTLRSGTIEWTDYQLS